MKIRILDRILVAAAGLLMLAGCAALAAQLFFGKDVVGYVSKILSDDSCRIWLIAAMVILLLVALYCIRMLFRHRGRNDKFVMQKTENGELAISLKAMESMVLKCLDTHKELTVQGIRLESQKGGLLIHIRGAAAGGVSIPLTVDALQQQIKQYVTACSGVEVKDIRVQIESSGPDSTDSMFAVEAPIARALPGSSGDRNEQNAEEKPKEEEPESPPRSQEELDRISAEIQAPPQPSEAEDENTPQIEISAAAAAAAELLKSEAPPEEDDRPIHQRLFSNPEEPCVMPMPPTPEETEPTEKAEPAEKAEPTEKAEPAAEKNAEAEEKEAGQKETIEGSEAE